MTYDSVTGLRIGDVCEIFDWGSNGWDGQLFTITRLEKGYQSVIAYNKKGEGSCDAMYTKNLRLLSTPEEFIYDV